MQGGFFVPYSLVKSIPTGAYPKKPKAAKAKYIADTLDERRRMFVERYPESMREAALGAFTAEEIDTRPRYVISREIKKPKSFPKSRKAYVSRARK